MSNHCTIHAIFKINKNVMLTEIRKQANFIQSLHKNFRSSKFVINSCKFFLVLDDSLCFIMYRAMGSFQSLCFIFCVRYFVEIRNICIFASSAKYSINDRVS